MSKGVPSDPSKVMVIRDITPSITTFSSPFARIGLIKVGGRGTLVKMQNGSLAVFSPVSLTDEVKAKVASQGKLKYIVAPDFEHHIFLSAWAKQYPEAEVICVDGLPEKREKNDNTKGTTYHHVFTAKNKRDLHIGPEFDSEFEYEFIHGHVNKELVMLHKPSRTMIEADFLWNLPAHEQYSKTGEDATSGILTKIATYFTNTSGEMSGQRRFVWYAGAVDKKAFAESVKKIHTWDYDRVIPCHGDVIETGGKNVVDHLTAWFREM